MLRRSLAVLATTFAAAAAVALPLAPAQAAGTCTFTPPARIAIYSNFTDLPATITGDCQPNGYGYWSTPGDFDSNDNPKFAIAQFGAFYGPTPAAIYVPDVLGRYGLQTWGADEAGTDDQCGDGEELRSARTFAQRAQVRSEARTQAECGDLTQNTPASDIRLGAYAAISGTRNTASKVTFTVTSAVWSTGSDKLVNRSMKGVLQTQYADGTWHNVGNTITTAANGKSTFSVGLPRRTFRFAVYSTTYSFDRVSAALTR